MLQKYKAALRTTWNIDFVLEEYLRKGPE